MTAEGIATIVGWIVVASSLLNSATKHWSEIPGRGWQRIWRMALWIIERLSLIQSVDSPGQLKWPFIDGRSGSGGRAGGGAAAAIALLALSSCGTWRDDARSTLDRVYNATRTGEKSVIPALNARCEAVARGCAASKDATCQPLVKCQEERDGVVAAAGAVYSATASALIAVSAESDADRARAMDAVARAVDLARKAAALIGAAR